MVEDEIRGNDNGNNETVGNGNGIEAKRAKLHFKRATANDTASSFGSASTTANPRKQRPIPSEKRSQVTISDTRTNSAEKVRGNPPKEPVEEPEITTTKAKVGRPRKRNIYPTIEDSKNQAQFLLSAVEVACVTASGPAAEMSDWERGVMSAPLQRMIQRTPLSVVEKGGVIFDCAFLIMGGTVYFGRVFKGFKLPSFVAKKQVKGVQEDRQSPVAAPVMQTVSTVKAGDIDGLAQPIPAVISQTMNGAI